MNEAHAHVRRAWVTVGVWLAFQLTLTTLPGSAIPQISTSFRLDWVGHTCMYFGLGFLIARAWILSGRRAALLIGIWLAISCFGALDELHQLFIPGRSAEVGDWIMDTMGGALGLLVGTLMMRARWAAKLLR